MRSSRDASVRTADLVIGTVPRRARPPAAQARAWALCVAYARPSMLLFPAPAPAQAAADRVIQTTCAHLDSLARRTSTPSRRSHRAPRISQRRHVDATTGLSLQRERCAHYESANRAFARELLRRRTAVDVAIDKGILYGLAPRRRRRTGEGTADGVGGLDDLWRRLWQGGRGDGAGPSARRAAGPSERRRQGPRPGRVLGRDRRREPQPLDRSVWSGASRSRLACAYHSRAPPRASFPSFFFTPANSASRKRAAGAEVARCVHPRVL